MHACFDESFLIFLRYLCSNTTGLWGWQGWPFDAALDMRLCVCAGTPSLTACCQKVILDFLR